MQQKDLSPEEEALEKAFCRMIALMQSLNDETFCAKEDAIFASAIYKSQHWQDIFKATQDIYKPLKKEIKHARKKFKELYPLDD